MEGKPEKKKKPLLIHPRKCNMFENPVKMKGKKGHGSKQQVVIENFVKSLDSQEQWETFFNLKSRMAVIEVSVSSSNFMSLLSSLGLNNKFYFVPVIQKSESLVGIWIKCPQ